MKGKPHPLDWLRNKRKRLNLWRHCVECMQSCCTLAQKYETIFSLPMSSMLDRFTISKIRYKVSRIFFAVKPWTAMSCILYTSSCIVIQSSIIAVQALSSENRWNLPFFWQISPRRVSHLRLLCLGGSGGTQ